MTVYFYFQINDEDVHLYKDAVSGRDIVECKTTVCAIRPCKNGAVCTQHEDNGSWFCNCPPGFTGSLCERPVCTTNPCRYGGTCLGSQTGPGFLCLCPVGRGGALCTGKGSFTNNVFPCVFDMLTFTNNGYMGPLGNANVSKNTKKNASLFAKTFLLSF